jgi:hypothetical protein
MNRLKKPHFGGGRRNRRVKETRDCFPWQSSHPFILDKSRYAWDLAANEFADLMERTHTRVSEGVGFDSGYDVF